MSASWLALGVGVFLVVSSILGYWMLRRREQIERHYTAYSNAQQWEKAFPFALLLARMRADPQTLGRRQHNLGNVLLKLSRWDEARDAFGRALDTQLACEDPYAALSRANLAWLELRSGRAGAAREQAAAIARDAPPELKGRAPLLEAASWLVEGKPEKTREMLEPRLEELKASKKPTDALALAVLAAALGKAGENDRALELGRVASGRLPEAQRREFTGMAPFLAGVLGS